MMAVDSSIPAASCRRQQPVVRWARRRLRGVHHAGCGRPAAAGPAEQGRRGGRAGEHPLPVAAAAPATPAAPVPACLCQLPVRPAMSLGASIGTRVCRSPPRPRNCLKHHRSNDINIMPTAARGRRCKPAASQLRTRLTSSRRRSKLRCPALMGIFAAHRTRSVSASLKRRLVHR